MLSKTNKNYNNVELTKMKGSIIAKGKQLHNLRNRNLNTKHQNYKLHYLLCDPFTFANAYSKISKNKGALTKGIKEDEEMIKLFGISKAEVIAQKFKTNSYKWSPVRRKWIPKPGKSELRPIDTPTQEDRIVQEAIRGILEAIFEPEFQEFEILNKYSSTNYGFRPNKSTQLAVDNIKLKGQRAIYVIEGDIKGAYNNVNHQILLRELKRRIKDKQFLKVIKEMLISGIMDTNHFTHTLRGTPQGGIVSPLLFNIYMFKLDKHIYQNYTKKYQTLTENTTKKQNPSHKNLGYKISQLSKNLKNETTKQNRKNILKEIKSTRKDRLKIPSYEINTLPKTANFTRYADDWVLLLTCNKTECLNVKTNIKSWISDNLKMELDDQKTKITRLDEGFNFLGYRIKSNKPNQNKYTFTLHRHKNKTSRFLKQTTSRKISIIPDIERLRRTVVQRKFAKGFPLKPISIGSWTLFTEYQIVQKYRRIMIGLYNYYKECDSHYALNYISYILQYSCAKTIARRKKITIGKVFKLYGTEMTISENKQNTKQQNKTLTVSFPTYTKLKSLNWKHHSNTLDYDPFNIINFWRTSFKIYNECCICGNEDNIQLHHINSLQKVKDKKDHFGYIRSSLNRLQIPVCHQCHTKITQGTYNDKKPIQYYNEFLARL